MLDDLLPLLEPRRAELHLHAAVIEVSDAHQLLELAANPKVRRHLLARLSDTVAVVDPRHVEALVRALLKRYGGPLSGPVVLAEAQARGLVEREDPQQRPFYGRREEHDPIHQLGHKMLVVPPSGGIFGRYGFYSYSSYRQSYPDLA